MSLSGGNKNFFTGLGLAVAVLAIYVIFLPSTLAPYRDAGEMAVDIWSMSVSHQPGYPLYNLLGRFFSFFLPGTVAYKLNLFSAICGAAAIFFLYFLTARRYGCAGATFFSLLFAFNFTMHTVSSVSEMYSLNIFFASVLLFLAFEGIENEFSERDLFLFAFLCGLAMGNRMDISLMYPPFLAFIFFRLNKQGEIFLPLIRALFFFLAGFSIYLYLPFVSVSDPLINWSNPSNPGNFINVITRKSYGSTLDLISLNYRIGEMFLPNMKVYGLHLAKNFNLALFFVLVGFYREYVFGRRMFYFLGGLFVLTGPVFLFMANMPPNPHSLSIVEPYYLIPDLILIIFGVSGFDFLRGRARPWPSVVICLSLAATCYVNFPHSWRRNLSIARDYAVDVFRDIPKNSILVAKKDVQLFSLWYFAYAEGMRPDLAIIGQGLSGSIWYQASRINRGTVLVNLNEQDSERWRELKKRNGRRLFVTLDSVLPQDLPNIPNGLTCEVLPEKEVRPPSAVIFKDYSLDSFKKPYNDFFVADLASSYAQALVSMAAYSLNSGIKDGALPGLLDKAAALDDDLADAPLYKGLYYAGSGNWRDALSSFETSVNVYKKLLAKAEEYYSLKDVKSSLRKGVAYALLNLGVCYEKLGDRAKSEENYLLALYYNPSMAQAHYNLAILYWKIDPKRVREELVKTLELDPGHKEAKHYLSVIQAR